MADVIFSQGQIINFGQGKTYFLKKLKLIEDLAYAPYNNKALITEYVELIKNNEAQ